MTAASLATPFSTRHILGEPSLEGQQRCILCGISVADHPLGHLPAGEVFERQGRLYLIEPDGRIRSCQEGES